MFWSLLRQVVCVLVMAVPVWALTPTPTITPVASQDCCTDYAPDGLPGCNDSTCEACICVGDGISNDPSCCTVLYDFQCEQEAKGLYTVLVSCASSCACSVAATPTPTPVVTPTPVPFLCCDCFTEDCQAPINNICPTPCTAVPNAVCP
jgi:hypothetical protein